MAKYTAEEIITKGENLKPELIFFWPTEGRTAPPIYIHKTALPGTSLVTMWQQCFVGDPR